MKDPKVSDYAEMLKRGGVVAFPTETVYGLGASVFHEEAIRRIFAVKGRPQDNPLIVHIGSFEQLDLIVEKPTSVFERLAEAFFPGPLTVLLAKLRSVPAIVSAGLPMIGVRMPDHPVALELIQAVGAPLVAPSANRSGRPSSTCAEHVREDFGNLIDGILDGGPCSYGIESTVLMLDPFLQILRPGAITHKQLEEVLGCPVGIADAHADRPLSPGMKYRHYAPLAKVHVFNERHDFENFLNQSSSNKRMILEKVHPESFYASLRQADSQQYDEVVIFCDEETKQNTALMNRISRASQ
jgi:L-threonylcarbamoyladenylate synthase